MESLRVGVHVDRVPFDVSHIEFKQESDVLAFEQIGNRVLEDRVEEGLGRHDVAGLKPAEEAVSDASAQEVNQTCMDLVGLPFQSAVFHLVSFGHLGEAPLLLDPLMQSNDDL